MDDGPEQAGIPPARARAPAICYSTDFSTVMLTKVLHGRPAGAPSPSHNTIEAGTGTLALVT
jgi:hypothetical protein